MSMYHHYHSLSSIQDRRVLLSVDCHLRPLAAVQCQGHHLRQVHGRCLNQNHIMNHLPPFQTPSVLVTPPSTRTRPLLHPHPTTCCAERQPVVSTAIVGYHRRPMEPFQMAPGLLFLPYHTSTEDHTTLVPDRQLVVVH